jgi:hypothetical protein
MTLASAMWNFISYRDHKLMLRVNRWPAPRWIRVWMLCATRGGDGWLWYGMALIIALFGGDQRLPAIGARARLNRIAGPRCCRPTSFPSPRAIPSRRLPWR